MKLNHFYSYFWAIKEIKKQNGKLKKDGWGVKKNLNCLPKFITDDFYSTDNFITDYKKLDLIRHRNYLYEKNSNATLHKYS